MEGLVLIVRLRWDLFGGNLKRASNSVKQSGIWIARYGLEQDIKVNGHFIIQTAEDSSKWKWWWQNTVPDLFWCYKGIENSVIIYSSLNNCGQYNAVIADDKICYDLVIKWKVNKVFLYCCPFFSFSLLSLSITAGSGNDHFLLGSNITVAVLGIVIPIGEF